MKHQGKHEPKKKGKCTKDASKFKRKEVYLEKVGFGRCYDSDIELGVDIIHCMLSLESPLLLPPFWIVQRMEEIKEEIEAYLTNATTLFRSIWDGTLSQTYAGVVRESEKLASSRLHDYPLRGRPYPLLFRC